MTAAGVGGLSSAWSLSGPTMTFALWIKPTTALVVNFFFTSRHTHAHVLNQNLFFELGPIGEQIDWRQRSRSLFYVVDIERRFSSRSIACQR
jgi:hypothetical protein